MTTEISNNILDRGAKIISMIFHPLFIPVYGLIIIFTAPTLFGYLPPSVKRILLLMVLVNNVFIPFSLLPYLKFRNIISSWSIDNRKERFIPLLVTSIFYSFTSIVVFRFQLPMFLKSFLFATSFVAITITVINFFWKISIHATGTGLLTALVLMLAFRMYASLSVYIISVLLVAGLVLASRLRLNLHNPAQVWFGFLIGFSGLFLFMMII